MNEELEYFYEDVKAQLDFMEQALMDIAQSGANDEAVGAIFRAMHTIKGTAGMFDFVTIVSFTHIAENLLDEIRHHTITLNDDMLEAFLQVKDHVESLVTAAMAGNSLSNEQQSNDIQLRNTLSAFLDKSVQSPDNNPPMESSQNSDECVWHISLRFKEDFFKTGMDILSIFDYFPTQGDVIALLPITNAIVSLEEYDPLTPAIGFEIFFLSSGGKGAIEEIFEFVVDDIELIIIPADSTAQLQELISKRPEIVQVLRDASMYEHALLETQSPSKPKQISQEAPKKPPVPNVNSEPIKENIAPKNSFLRVDFQKIDILISQLSEMVTANAKIAQMTLKYDDAELEEATHEFSEMLDELRGTIMDIRMVQVEESFVKFRRNVSDVAKKVGKTIDFSITGGETELDKMVVEKLSDPLVHMLRNSIDHGIEKTIEERRLRNKPDNGQIWLRARAESGMIIIEIEDDGQGLNTEVIRQKAIEKGLISSSDELGDNAVNMLIFHPGFSTSQEVSDISGRGVGMDVVKKNIESLKGRIDILNRVGLGCKFVITLPLTLAIIDGFLVQAGATKYIIPQNLIQEVLELREGTLMEVAKTPLLNLRGELLPLLNIKRYFGDNNPAVFERENIVIIQYGSRRAGLVTEELFGEHQTVVKTLGPLFESVVGVSGGTILGDGEVALIVDIPALIEDAIHHDQRG